MVIFATWKEIARRSGETPIGPQDAQQLRRQHHVPVLAAFAAAHRNYARALSMSSTPRPTTSEVLSPAA